MDNPFQIILDRLDRLESLLSGQAVPSLANDQPAASAEILDGKALCERLHISEPTLIRWRQKGKIPFIKLGSSFRYNWASVLSHLEKTPARV